MIKILAQPFFGKAGLIAFAGGFSEAFPSIGLGDEHLRSFRDGRGIPRRHKEAVHSLFHGLRDRPLIHADDGQAIGERFDQGDRQAFWLARREEKEMRFFEEFILLFP